ncbi:hypothetical protein PACILC2_22500 [Paenibacillus cisolokensis]|uniref:YopX protein domain-containing protein n=1 Tax=Paenibacillus cisolokensis TaxID=1658519 RepID=A0ABQ4N698_9BACL|nr:hypothetical protein [Paenibacillus cisolokensis]GIQ63682.1 hypothetical protein PACILC2_22500 [Paenibacillus cisolokensis]
MVARYTGAHSEVKFVVNREKRTVVALRYYCGVVDNRGIAKCAPGDVFNTHIGRAISLRRALGLTVPDEYLNAPQPTEPRVGDIVETRNGPQKVYAVRPTHRTVGVYAGHPFAWSDEGYTYIFDGYEWWCLIKDAVILDDSREGVSE